MTCKFDIDWVGRCRESKVNKHFCEKHNNLPCDNCYGQSELDRIVGSVGSFPITKNYCKTCNSELFEQVEKE